jgi:hypothetical protein
VCVGAAELVVGDCAALSSAEGSINNTRDNNIARKGHDSLSLDEMARWMRCDSKTLQGKRELDAGNRKRAWASTTRWQHSSSMRLSKLGKHSVYDFLIVLSYGD